MFEREAYKSLTKWKKKKNRKPLVVRGARQVGKTSLILDFAKKEFKDLVHINLERQEHARLFQTPLSLSEFLEIVSSEFASPIVNGETLIFIDEIQNSPHLISLLRFLYEDKPGLHVISAGSLLEAVLKRENISFPVGRVEFVHLFPMTFFEYLKAKGELQTLDYLKNLELTKNSSCQISETLHQEILDKFYTYTQIGGMPEAVSTFLEHGDTAIPAVKRIHESLFQTYIEDVPKYASPEKEKYIEFAIDNAPLASGTATTVNNFGGSTYRSREMSEAFNILQKCMILNRIKATKSIKLPLIPKTKKARKLLFVDVGLVNYRMGILPKYTRLEDLDSFYNGRIAEQIVGQTLLSILGVFPERLFYWFRKSASTAEVDFIFSLDGQLYATEVKSGKRGRLKSLKILSKMNPQINLTRIYSGPPRLEKLGDKKLLSLPFYLLERFNKV